MWNVICAGWQYGHSLFIRAGSQLHINGPKPPPARKSWIFSRLQGLQLYQEGSIGPSRAVAISNLDHRTAAVRCQVRSITAMCVFSLSAFTATWWVTIQRYDGGIPGNRSASVSDFKRLFLSFFGGFFSPGQFSTAISGPRWSSNVTRIHRGTIMLLVSGRK